MGPWQRGGRDGARVILALALVACPGGRSDPPPATSGPVAGSSGAGSVEAEPGDVSWTDPASPIKRDEVVELFPALTHPEGDGWVVEIRGRIFEPERGDLLRGGLIAAIEAAAGVEGGSPRSALFEQRARALLSDSERGKRLVLAVGERKIRSPPSDAGGMFRVALEVTHAELRTAGGSSARVRALTRPGDGRRFSGPILTIPARGLTIISDIDDTIRDSRVTDKRELVRRTLFEPFVVVPGVAARYRGWMQGEGDRLLFVSASPWQLYGALSEMVEGAGFGPAAFSLRALPGRLRDVDDLFQKSGDVKRASVAEAVARDPQRSFVFVGDSGEGDPEMYGEIARAHPASVRAIFIREVGGGDNRPARFEQAFTGVERGRWATFSTGADLPAALP